MSRVNARHRSIWPALSEVGRAFVDVLSVANSKQENHPTNHALPSGCINRRGTAPQCLFPPCSGALAESTAAVAQIGGCQRRRPFRSAEPVGHDEACMKNAQRMSFKVRGMDPQPVKRFASGGLRLPIRSLVVMEGARHAVQTSRYKDHGYIVAVRGDLPRPELGLLG